MRHRLSVIMALALLALAAQALALPSGDEVLRRVREARSGIRDYTVDVDVHVEMEGVKVPDVSVRVLHKAPDKTKLQPLKGFAILPKGALLPGDPFAGLGKHFTAKVLGTATVAGRPTYRLKLTPKGEGGGRPVQAHVDRERWNVLKITSETPSGDPITVEMAYQRVQERFWLPSRTVAHFKLPDDMPHRGGGPDDPGFRMAGQKGTVTATFRSYKVNTGLSDSLFREEPRKGKRRQRRI